MEVKKSAKIYMFLLPFCGEEKDKIYNDDFKGIYTKMKGTPEKEGRIYAEITDGIFAIDIPKEVYKKVLAGKYSTLTEDDKEKILTFWEITGKEDILYFILNPLSHFKSIGYIPRRRDVEIWPAPTIEERTYKHN